MCRNPRLLSFAAVLGQDRLRAVAGAGRALSPARLYEDVFTSWIDYEERRGQGGAGAAPGLGAQALWSSVTALALHLWESGRTALRLDELTANVTDTLSGLTGPLSLSSALSTAERAQAVGAGSLLVRSDDGVFQFIHGSVLEWLVAREAASRLDAGHDLLLTTRPFSQLAVEFLCDLADHGTCARWVQSILDPDGPAVCEAARANALRIGDRLRVPAGVDLRGARLAGEDLSYRDFSGADLSGADLTRCRLTGATLTGATLTGAGLTGSRWHRAALIAPVLDHAVRTAPELRAAAIAPGMAVQAGHRPSSVGGGRLQVRRGRRR